MIKISLIGTGGMLPLPNRHLASCLVEYNGKSILIDCGEGTQVSLRRGKYNISKIDAIFITHCHADHIAGLPGLLLTIGNCSRTEPMYIYGPVGTKEVVQSLMIVCSVLPYELKIVELSYIEPEKFKSIDLEIISIPLEHHVNCIGYTFELALKPRFNPEKAKELKIPVQYWKELHRGNNIEINGNVINSSDVVGANRKPIKLSYCTDTRPNNYIAELVKNSDLLICEGMYGENEQYENAVKKKHMLFSEAANIAKEGNVEELWLTHYSPSLMKPELYIDEVRKIFHNTIAGYDLMTKDILPKD